MYNYTLSLFSGLLAMAFAVCSYFARKKTWYLCFQGLSVTGLMSSYFFNVQFFAMLSLLVALVRILVFCAYEKNNKKAPVYLAYLFSLITVVAYYLVNFVWQKTANPWDIVCLIASIMYTFITRIRDLKIVRFTMLAPTSLNIVFNIATHATPFVIGSYIFELCANLVSIYKYHIKKEKITQSVEKENTYEKH